MSLKNSSGLTPSPRAIFTAALSFGSPRPLSQKLMSRCDTPQGLSAITDYEEEQERKAADEQEKLNEQSRVRAERVKDTVKDVIKDAAVALAAKLLNRSS